MTSSSESLSLALKLSTRSLLGDSGGKLASSFELGGPSLSLGTLSTPISEFKLTGFKVARYSFSGPIPPKFEHKLRRHKQSFGKIATPVVY